MLDTVLTRIFAPTGAVGFALVAEAHASGLFNAVTLPAWIELVLALFLLDLAIYLQHRLFITCPSSGDCTGCNMPADLDVDVTTGVRFHPGEILLSLGIKLIVILSLGTPASAVLLFEIGLNATSMFNHSNVRIPSAVERLVRWFVVTPDMHRVHHSVVPRETDSNFGFNFPWWDRLFGTYRSQPEAGHQAMTLGIGNFRDPKELRLHRMLMQPFRDDPGQSEPVEKAANSSTKAS